MASHRPSTGAPAAPSAADGAITAARNDLEREALLRVAAAAAGASHVEDVLELAAEEALEAVGAASLSVSRYEIERNEIRTLINVGDLGPGEVRFPENETYPASDYELVRDLVENHRPYFNNADDPECDPLAVRLLRELGKASDVGVPIIVEGEVWGEVWATRRSQEPPFDSADAEFLTGIAGQFAVAIARAELFSRVNRLAYEDALTGLPNRRAVEERLERALERSGRAGTGVALLLCDLDRLKEINDTYGHEAGDSALRNVARSLVRCAAHYPGAFVARLAGDEFCVVMEERPLADALALGNRVLEDLAAATGESLSCGAAVATGPTPRPTELLAHADAALYIAKRGGGGRVCSASTKWNPIDAPGRTRRGDPRATVMAALDTVAADLDGRLAKASALERLEAVAGLFTEVGDFAYWAISSALLEPDLIRDVALGDNRDLHNRGIRVETGAHEYRLSDFPVTRELIEAGSGVFTAAVGDPEVDEAEKSLLEKMGFLSVIGAAAVDGDCAYLVELYGDERTAPHAGFITPLRLAVRAAMPPRPDVTSTDAIKILRGPAA